MSLLIQCRINKNTHTLMRICSNFQGINSHKGWLCVPVSMSCLENNSVLSALIPNTILLYPDSVNDYFGNPLAYYFSFLDFYTWSLLPPAVLGLVITYFSGRCVDASFTSAVLQTLLMETYGDHLRTQFVSCIQTVF